ncbi:shikimate dehydrogenase [Nitrincola sp. MINF-07-Sa-05]|uniref:shikimate dehydrogenase n=1 Tax=Nitrincola salilacus TaxID=3400273 RepID=UPI0039181CC6
MIDKYAVFGHPINHSKSPLIHGMFAAQQDQLLEYTAVDIAEEEFEQRVEAFLQEPGKGLNITVPFKERAWALAAVRTERAELAGAVNTLWRDESGSIRGDNTDGAGLVADLTCNHRIQLDKSRILLLGAGGAARGVIKPLLDAGASELVIANRTLSKAQLLVSVFGPVGSSNHQISACDFQHLPEGNFDLIINATSAGLSGETPDLPVHLMNEYTICYDMLYGTSETPFCRWARQHQASKSLDGLGMLVEQAAESFLIWRGIKPDTAPVIEALRQSLGQQ